MQLAGSRVLVTGADGGIGRPVVAALRARGAEPVLTARDAGHLEAVAGSYGLAAYAADLTSAAAGRRLGERVLEDGPVDAVVHLAGIGLRGPVVGLDPRDAERVLAVCVAAPIGLTRALLPAMLAGGAGHVSFVGSVAGSVPVAQEAVYGAAKAALAHFADSLRLEVAGRGVEVSLVSPGAVDTSFFDRRGTAYHRPWPRPLPPERVAARIVDAVERGRARTVLPSWMGVAARVRGLSPTLYERLAVRFD